MPGEAGRRRRETGEDAVRAAMARIAMGRCPECGAPLDECTVH